MQSEWCELFGGRGALVAGVLSGTSADGIDVGIARMRATRHVSETADARSTWTLEPPQLVHYACEPFPPALNARVRAVLDGAPCSLRQSAFLSRDLALAFGAAARDVALRCGVTLDLVGSHGQTVWHHDGACAEGRATWQLGDGDFVAQAAGCAVVSDFRQADLAAGGEGAPLSALADGSIFAAVERPTCVLNLGGLANVTWLGARPDDLLAFDTGPAGCLLDALARKFIDRPFDEDGAYAARGVVRERAVERALAHPFFERAPPKSTGRDTFGEEWVRNWLSEMPDVRGEDAAASAVEVVARSIALAARRFMTPLPKRWLVAGGGAKNQTLMRALARELLVPVDDARAIGVDPDAREALVFAILAARAVLEIPSTHPGATGARRGTVLGKLSARPQSERTDGGTPPATRPATR